MRTRLRDLGAPARLALFAVGLTLVGGIAGDLAGTALASVAGPLGPFVKVAGSIFGAMLGAHKAQGAKIDWGRLAFTTALSAAVAVPLLASGPFAGFVAGFVGTSNLLRDEVAERILGTRGTFGKVVCEPA